MLCIRGNDARHVRAQTCLSSISLLIRQAVRFTPCSPGISGQVGSLAVVEDLIRSAWLVAALVNEAEDDALPARPAARQRRLSTEGNLRVYGPLVFV